MVINHIDNPGGVGPIKKPDAQPAEPSKVRLSAPKPAQVADRNDIARKHSDDARITQNAKLVLDSLPDIRRDKVELAKQRLKAGFYDRPEIKEEIAAKMLADPEARPLSELSPERSTEIQRRLETGFYKQPEVTDEIARKMLDDARRKDVE